MGVRSGLRRQRSGGQKLRFRPPSPPTNVGMRRRGREMKWSWHDVEVHSCDRIDRCLCRAGLGRRRGGAAGALGGAEAGGVRRARDRRWRRADRIGGAEAGARRGAGADHRHHQAGRRHHRRHGGDRRQSGPGRGARHLRPARRSLAAGAAGARQPVYLHARGGGDRGRRAARDRAVREGGGRLLGAGRRGRSGIAGRRSGA